MTETPLERTGDDGDAMAAGGEAPREVRADARGAPVMRATEPSAGAGRATAVIVLNDPP